MTAIISILNKTTVALAGDSAATVGSGDTSKVYNHANKIFNLTPSNPVGIAIYNASEVMGIPWETIIKMYRRQFGEKELPELKHYGASFLQYLRETLCEHVTPEEQAEQVTFIAARVADELRRATKRLVKERFEPDVFAQWPPDEQQDATAVAVRDMLHTMEQRVSSLPFLPDFENYPLPEFLTTYEAAAAGPLRQALQEYNVSEQDLLSPALAFVHQVVCRQHFYERWTGLVVAGFGEKDLYPRLVSYKVGAVIGGRIRYHEDVVQDITNKSPAAIAPFAQTDSMMSFLAGIDPLLQQEVSNIMDATLEKFRQEVVAQLPPERQEAMDVPLRQAAEKLVQNLGERLSELCQVKHIDPVLNTIVQLSKEDLAEMAESLISLTYLKRRVTFDKESVGGPVDVALITKGDGFVWIKRKHYFQPALNLNYLAGVLQAQHKSHTHDVQNQLIRQQSASNGQTSHGA